MRGLGESRQRWIWLRVRNKPENKQEVRSKDFAIILWHGSTYLHNGMLRSSLLVCAEGRMWEVGTLHLLSNPKPHLQSEFPSFFIVFVYLP